MTQQEQINLVNSLIIDNNTNQVTPAKVRQALIAIIESQPTGSGNSLVPKLPISIDGFTNIISLKPNPFKTVFLIQKGMKDSSENESDNIELGDICMAMKPDATEWGFWMYVTQDGTNPDQNLDNYTPISTTLIPTF